MINTLKLVRGAVASKDLVPVLTHFHIYDGRIQGSNGTLSIDAPCEELTGIDVTVPSERFIKAVDACDGEPQIEAAEDFLQIKRSRFRAKLPLAEHDSFPRAELKGQRRKMPFELLPVLKALSLFMATDASRPWAVGILLRNGAAWATNNIIIARYSVDWSGGNIGIPAMAVEELLRIGREPTHYRITDGSMVFEFKGGAWLKTALLAAEAPTLEDFNKAIDVPMTSGWYSNIGVLADAVDRIAPFCPDPLVQQVIFDAGGVTTGEGSFSASMAVPVPGGARFHIDPLQRVLAWATDIDFALYPKPMPWRRADGTLAGLIVGIRT